MRTALTGVLFFAIGCAGGETLAPDGGAVLRDAGLDAASVAHDASSPDDAGEHDAGPADASPPRPDADVSGLRSVREWQALFDGVTEREHARYLPLSTSGNGWDLYDLAYSIDGLTAMFRATGDRAYLERALGYAENVVATARPSSSLPASQFRDGFLGWPSTDHPSDESIRGGEYALFESYLFRYVARMLRAMRDAPGVLADPALRARYEALLAFTRRHVFEKWMSRGASAHVYRSRTHMASHWALIALELAALTEDPAERGRYRAVVDAIDRGIPGTGASLRAQMRPHPRAPGAYFWSAVWGSSEPPGQDVAHGNAVVTYVVEAHDDALSRGVPGEWTDADVRALATLLRDVIWMPSEAGAQHAEFVDGSGEGNGWINDGFCKLGRHDVAIQRRLESYGVGRGWQLYGNAALNAFLLGAL